MRGHGSLMCPLVADCLLTGRFCLLTCSVHGHDLHLVPPCLLLFALRLLRQFLLLAHAVRLWLPSIAALFHHVLFKLLRALLSPPT